MNTWARNVKEIHGSAADKLNAYIEIEYKQLECECERAFKTTFLAQEFVLGS